MQLPSRATDITGKRFNSLTALTPVSRDASGSVVWHCVCECGKTRDVPIRKLTTGKVPACRDCMEVVRAENHRKAIKRVLAEKYAASRAAKSERAIRKTAMGTRVRRVDGVTRHYMEAVNMGEKLQRSPGPSAYGRPDLFAFAWPPIERAEVA